MRAVTAIAALMLAGCGAASNVAKTEPPAPDPAICRHVQSADQFEASQGVVSRLDASNDPGQNEAKATAAYDVATSCIYRTAYKFAGDTQPEAVVATAVVDACDPQILQASMFDALNRDAAVSRLTNQSPGGSVDDFEKQDAETYAKQAVAAVVEARVGHCKPVP